jgi:hypothetical protein
MSQQIKYDVENDEFFIESITGYGTNEKVERLDLSAWHMVKEITVYIHVQRQIEKSDFNNPIQIINYSLPLTYRILNIASGRNVYLRLEKKTSDVPIRDNIRANWVTVYLKDVDLGTCKPAPIINQLHNAGDWDYLEITKGEVKELNKKELIALFKSGLCIGSYDYSLQNRLTV